MNLIVTDERSHMTKQTLKLGMIGAGFVAKFHARALMQVRGVEIAGITAKANAEELSKFVKANGLGQGIVYSSVAEMANHVDAIAIFTPNFTRVEIVEKIVDAVKKGAALKGLICEKPLARNLKEARRIVDLVNEVKLKTAYFENQIFMKPIRTQLQQLAPQQKTMGKNTAVRTRAGSGIPRDKAAVCFWIWVATALQWDGIASRRLASRQHFCNRFRFQRIARC
ncbi:hypothetical protein DCC62_19280 [candidate division KSB1 bacterium]|nr:MAG: hypothetical protein DCC62_19280 [candidate division KSB1 bacterium]